MKSGEEERDKGRGGVEGKSEGRREGVRDLVKGGGKG